MRFRSVDEAAEAVAAARVAARLGRRAARALAREELRLIDKLGGDESRYASLRAFLRALGR